MPFISDDQVTTATQSTTLRPATSTTLRPATQSTTLRPATSATLRPATSSTLRPATNTDGTTTKKKVTETEPSKSLDVLNFTISRCLYQQELFSMYYCL